MLNMLKRRIPRMGITEFSRNVFGTINELQNCGLMEITRQSGKPSCYIISQDEYDNLMKILSDPVEYNKIMYPDFSNSKAYRTVDEAINDICGSESNV